MGRYRYGPEGSHCIYRYIPLQGLYRDPPILAKIGVFRPLPGIAPGAVYAVNRHQMGYVHSGTCSKGVKYPDSGVYPGFDRFWAPLANTWLI